MTTTILWADGFDHYNSPTDAGTVYASIAWLSQPAGRTDGLAIQCRSYFDSLHFQNLAPQTDIGVCFAVQPTAPGIIPFYFKDNATGAILATVDLSVVNLVTVTCNGVAYTSPVPNLPVGNYSQISFHLTISASAGAFQLIFNGNTPVFSMSGINTTAGSGTITSCNSVHIVEGSQNGYNNTIYDDFIIYSGTPPGDIRVQTDFPTSNQSVTFTPLAGTNWQEVSEVAMDSDTTYNYTNTVGNVDLFNFTTLSVPTGSTILGIALVTACRKTDAGTRSIQNEISSSGTVANGATFNPSTSYQYDFDLFATDPHTSVAWTQAGINAAYCGYKCTA